MELALQLRYSSAADLRGHLFEHAEQGALLLPLTDLPTDLVQYAPLALEVVVGEERCAMAAEVLQVLPGNGIVVRLTDVAEASAMVDSAPIADPVLAPEVRIYMPELAELTFVTGEQPMVMPSAPPGGDPAEPSPEGGEQAEGAAEQVERENQRGGTKPKVGHHIAGSSPISWSHEQLVATWDQLTLAEKVRVARHGKRPARMMILKGLDKTLHIHVLNNNGVTPDEIAMMASMANLDPTVLRRIATDNQMLRHATTARNLICNPKLPLPLVTKLLKHVGRDDLSRLARTGKVRQNVKQLIIKMLDRTR